MGIFGIKKKNKKNKNKQQLEQSPPPSRPTTNATPSTTVVKYVGEEKHVTTTKTDGYGRQVQQTRVTKLTPAEMEELGIVPKQTKNSTFPYVPPPPAAAPATPAGLTNRQESLAGMMTNAKAGGADDVSMAGYSLAGFSEAWHSSSDNLNNPSIVRPSPTRLTPQTSPVEQRYAYGQPSNNNNLLSTSPVYEARSGGSASNGSTGMDTPCSSTEINSMDSSHDDRGQQQQRNQPSPPQYKNPSPPSATATKQQPNPSYTPPTMVENNTNANHGTAEENQRLQEIDITRELVKKFIADIWNRGEIELIPIICHPSLRFNGHVGMDKVGHDGFARMVTTVREALTDYHCEIHSIVVENNKAFCRLRFTGKHTGNLLGYQPTGKSVAWMGASEFTCRNGKILKVWELGDLKSLEEQLGA